MSESTPYDIGDEYSAQGAQALQAGEIEEGRECFMRAAEAYEAALGAAPEADVVLRANLGLCIGARRFGLGAYLEARVRYEEALARLLERPDLTGEGEGREVLLQARLNLAEVRLATGDAVAARREVENVLAKDPDHPYAPVLLARLDAEGEPAEEEEQP